MIEKMASNTKGNFKFMHVEEYSGAERAHSGLFAYEKIDGGNCSIRKEDGIVTPYSRARRLTSNGLSAFYFRDLFNWAHSIPELQSLPEDKILCGEWTHYGFGHICYNPEYMEKFFLLGVFDKDRGKYLHPFQVDEFVNSLGIEKNIVRLPVLHTKNMTGDIADTLVQDKSDFYDGLKEGIVIHKYHDSFRQGLRMEKYFNPEFQEISPDKIGIERYVTLRRMIKVAQNLRVNGKNFNFENVTGAAIDDILRNVHEYKKAQLFEAFNTPEMLELFQEKVLPLFRTKKR